MSSVLIGKSAARALGQARWEFLRDPGEELNGGIDVFHHDADVVHTLDRHDVSVASELRSGFGLSELLAAHELVIVSMGTNPEP